MTKPREKTREELTAEIEDSKKKIQQYENREKILRQKLSREERRERNHRLIVRGAVFESIVPEAKNMTDEEAPKQPGLNRWKRRKYSGRFALPVGTNQFLILSGYFQRTDLLLIKPHDNEITTL